MRREGGGGGDEEERGQREERGDRGWGLRGEGAGARVRSDCSLLHWKRDRSHRFIDEWSKTVGLFRAEMGLHAFVHCLTLFFFFFISLQYGNNYNLNYMSVK
jgi:hypothetical protein